MPLLLSLNRVHVSNHAAYPLKDIHFRIETGQHWAFVGRDDLGVAGLLQLLAGKIRPTSGNYAPHFARDYLSAHEQDGSHHSFHDLIAHTTPQHHFRSKANVQHFYHQQRFNSTEMEEVDTVLDYLQKQHSATKNGPWTLDRVLRLLNLHSLSDKKIIMLSNGESRRLTFAAALLKNPALLIMDRPLIGLDVETRKAFDGFLDEITRSGIHLIMSCGANEIPNRITHVGWLQEGKIAVQGRKSALDLTPLLLEEQNDTLLKNESLLRQELKTHRNNATYDHIVDMRDVHIKYGSKQVLKGIDWKVKQGEHWLVQGHNGAGKSTLLSLINGDHPQAYANRIVLFDKKRGSGESIWDIKKNVGYVSPEQHQCFPTDQSCLFVVLSGYYDTDGLFRTVSAQKQQKALIWMEILEIEHLKNKLFKNASSGEQRLCLLARALIKMPPLLLLDEPCQGLSVGQSDRFKRIIEVICEETTITLIHVSHVDREIPACIEKKIVLKGGEITASSTEN